MNIKKHFFNVLKGAVIVVLCSMLGAGLLFATFLISEDRIEKNVALSVQEIKDEGMYPVLYDWCTSRLDNSTDSIMLLEASDKTKDSLINRAFLVYRGYTGEHATYYSLIDHYIDGKDYDGEMTYARYWHGYLTYVKPLLSFLSYQKIRILNGVLQNLINLAIVFLLCKSKKGEYAIAYVITYLMLMPVAMAYSLQFSSCFYVFSISCLMLLIRKRGGKGKQNWKIFLFSGIATAFYDFLTYPIATIGMPLLFDELLNKKDSLKDSLVSIITKCIYWCEGYGLMWFSKWLIASVFTSENVILDGINTFLYRTQLSSQKDYSLAEMLYKNISKFFFTPFTVLFIIFCIAYIFFILKKKSSLKGLLQFAVPYLLIFMMPFAWYIVVSNHSMIHNYFTNKGLIVSLMSIMWCLIGVNEKYRSLQ